MDYKKISKWKSIININKAKLKEETDIKRRQQLQLKIQIDELKVKLEQLD